MANTVLTPTIILREAGRLFHQKAKFISSIDRSYDGRFAQTGAKAGDTIALRDPVQFEVTTGRTMNIQDITETSQNLTVATQKHVAFKFPSSDLSLKIDDFSKRYLEKGVGRLAAEVESLVLAACVKAVPNVVDGDAAAFAFTHAAQAKQRLDETVTPDDGTRQLLLCPTHSTKYLTDTKGLFTPTVALGGQYKSGMVSDALGFNVSTTSHLAPFTTGTAVATTGYSVDNSGTTSGATITLKSGSTTFLAGDVITIATLNAVHPETKADLGYLKQFVVTADSGASATSLSISPAIVYTGAYKNVSTASLGADRAVVKMGVAAVASATMVQSLAYHPDAFVFATADLYDPSREGKWAAVEVMDGISMRIWRDSDIYNDEHPCRIDVLYGSLARYTQQAVRIHADA
jgi:hypothetical protein